MMSDKFKKFLKEAKVIDGDEIHFDSAGGYFSGVSTRLIPDIDDNTYTVSPGTTDGGKYPIYRITTEDAEKTSQDLMKAVKKAADAMDKVLSSEMKKLGFKRIR